MKREKNERLDYDLLVTEGEHKTAEVKACLPRKPEDRWLHRNREHVILSFKNERSEDVTLTEFWPLRDPVNPECQPGDNILLFYLPSNKYVTAASARNEQIHAGSGNRNVNKFH